MNTTLSCSFFTRLCTTLRASACGSPCLAAAGVCLWIRFVLCCVVAQHCFMRLPCCMLPGKCFEWGIFFLGGVKAELSQWVMWRSAQWNYSWKQVFVLYNLLTMLFFVFLHDSPPSSPGLVAAVWFVFLTPSLISPSTLITVFKWLIHSSLILPQPLVKLSKITFHNCDWHFLV